MPESITFRGAYIRFFDVRLDKSGEVYVKIDMTADWTTPVAERMSWAAVGEGHPSGDLDGTLMATHMILTPGDKSLGGSEVQFDIKDVGHFKYVVNDGQDDKGKSVEIRFQIRSSDDDATVKLDTYFRRCGSHPGSLKVAYSKQENLPGMATGG